MAQIQLTDFVTDVVAKLKPDSKPEETDSSYRLKCPNLECGGDQFFLSKANGSGRCQDEGKNHSLWEIGRLLGMDGHGLYGIVTDRQSVNLTGTDVGTGVDSLRGLRGTNREPFNLAIALLQDPWLMDRLLWLAADQGFVGEKDNLRVLYLIITSRLAERLHVSLRGDSGAGKSETARFVLSMLPPEVAMHLGGGASKRAFQYKADWTRQIIFIDEADSLDDDLRAFLREAATRAGVTRLVTMGDTTNRFRSQVYTSITDGLVLIDAGVEPISDPADETRVLVLSPDTSPEQTSRILMAQAKKAAAANPQADADLDVWRKAQELLRPCRVIIPFADQLRMMLGWEATRSRRDFPRVLNVISAHACLYQYQRTSYQDGDQFFVVAEIEDYRRIHEFAAPVFIRATRGLTPTQEEVFTQILKYNKGVGNHFTFNQATAWTGKSGSTLRDHLKNLQLQGILEPRKEGAIILWHILSMTAEGVQLPDPFELFTALHSDGP